MNMRRSGFDEKMFHHRGGQYEWSKATPGGVADRELDLTGDDGHSGAAGCGESVSNARCGATPEALPDMEDLLKV